MNLFGMITTAESRDYTPVALRSFFAHTPAGEVAELVLIDNDGDFVLPDDVPADRITVIRRDAPQGFAQNANLLLARARALGADLFLLNNDLVFTTSWLEPLLANRRSLMSPMSNADVQHSIGAFFTQPAMDLAEYVGHERDVETIAEHHRRSRSGYRVVGSLAFFCIKIPRSVYDVVGDFDGRFGKGGGEDRDYAVRAWIAGIPLEFANSSYVLHFQGRSTWRGPETPVEQEERNSRFTKAFEQKWGHALAYAFLRPDWNLFRSDARLRRLLERQEFTPIVRHLRSHPSIEPFMARQVHARFAALCCVDDDDSWLAAAFESAYDGCTSIWFLVSQRPGIGPAPGRAALLDRLRVLPDPARKVRIVCGEWPDRAAQRNDGLRLIDETGAEYCFVLDADEIHDPQQLQRAIALVRSNPDVDCWSMSCFTCWKSYRYRVDPPEATPRVVFVRLGTGRFIGDRVYEAARHKVVPFETAAFHHMEYAPTDGQVPGKVTRFAAAHHRIVEQPYEALPPVMQRLWDACR